MTKFKEKSLFGKTFLGIRRTTFLIDPNGRIADIWLNVSVEDHASEVLYAIREINLK